MSSFRRITDQFYVAPQLTLEDISAAHEAGFQNLIMNRPSHETPDQPDTAEIVNEAERLGMTFYHIPIIAPPEASDIEATVAAIEDTKGQKTLAFCRSGTRSATLWAYAMAWKNTHDIDSILEMAAAAGYDLAAHTPRLKAIASA